MDRKVPKDLYPEMLHVDYYENNGLIEFDKKENVVSNVEKLLAAKGNKILVQGDVQSGKTNTLIEYIKRKTLDKSYFIIFLAGMRTNLKEQNADRFISHFDDINKKIDRVKYYTGAKEAARDEDIFRVQQILDEGDTYITTEIKNVNQLSNLAKMVNKLNCNILVIDDEGDEASLTNNTGERIKEILSCSKPSCRNSKECLRTENCNDAEYISITATPFKNLYFNEDYYDDFIVLKSGEGYRGLKDFKNNYDIIENPENFTEVVINPILDWIGKNVGKRYQDSQILYNLSISTNIHENIKNDIENFLRNGMILDKITYLPYELDFVAEFNKDNIYVTNNNTTSEEAEYHNNRMNEGHYIIIGGGNLSRGVTYKNLLVEVMTNAPKEQINAGTLLQRARWFGYKDNYKDFSIYITKDIENAFEELDHLNDWTKEYKLDGTYKQKFDDQNYGSIKI